MKNKSIFDRGIDFNSMYLGSEFIQPLKLFYLLNKALPSSLAFYNFDCSKISERVIKKFRVSRNDIISGKVYCEKKDENPEGMEVIAIRKNLLLVCDTSYSGQNAAIIFNSGTNKTLLKEVELIILSCKQEEDYRGNLFLLQKNDSGVFLGKYAVKSEIENVTDYYNDDFQEVHQTIINNLQNENGKGLVLLHGLPGAGKTSYLRYLTTILNKRIIFVPPDLMHMVATPGFLSVFNAYANSVIVIEDAENIIEQRRGGANSAVSNLLNISDGLLSECLKLQIICTFNTDLSKIDSALLRKGRLIARYEFKELEKQKAQELSDKLGFKKIIEKDMVLTEIVNQEKNYHNTGENKAIGFKKFTD